MVYCRRDGNDCSDRRDSCSELRRGMTESVVLIKKCAI